MTGQWGIDWDVYVLPDGPTHASVGNWAHRWHPGREQAEFREANGREYEERQHILRLNAVGSFHTVIVPWRKGAGRQGVAVRREGNRVTITEGDAVTTVENDSVTCSAAGKQSQLDLAKARATGSPP